MRCRKTSPAQIALPGFELSTRMVSWCALPATNGSVKLVALPCLIGGPGASDMELLSGLAPHITSRLHCLDRLKHPLLDFMSLSVLGRITAKPCKELSDTLTMLRLLNCTREDWELLTSISSHFRSVQNGLTTSLITQGSASRRLRMSWRVGKLLVMSANTPANRAVLCQKALDE